jgi:translation initiation factor 2D
LVDLNFDKFSFYSGKKGHEVLLQGGVIDDLAKHLIEQYGIPKRYIEVLDKTRK